ncbi:MAG TPA: peptidoglycan DD-metalloendopeptidase family protein [Acidimicrobiales bacterium]|nr:peptidoglycan DD-metalloendopeptidase family protein [Acidimicrobiales bacterium]
MAALLLLVAAAHSVPVRAQSDETPPEESTSTTEGEGEPLLPVESTTTTSPPTTTTTAPPNQTPPPEGTEPTDDSGPSEVPQDVVVVPPPEGEIAPDPSAPILQQIAGITLAEVQKGLRAAEQARLLAAGQTGGLTTDIAGLEARLAQLEADKAEAVARLQTARIQLKKRAVAGYMGSPAQPINQILAAQDFNDLSRRFELLSAVIESDKARIVEYNSAREAVGTELETVVTELDAKRSALTVASTVLDGADSVLLAKQIQMAAVRAGNAVVGGGFVFPIAGPHSYSDTFGAPRMFGTSYAHLHQGTDIFAASGTPLVAVERGVVIRMGSDVLGGTKLWLVGASGTRYYYAHLSGFAEGLVDNTVVSAGQLVGYVGNTGNALTTPAHLHFEVHPNGGPAVNPYPLLRIVDDAQKQIAATRPPTTTIPRS